MSVPSLTNLCIDAVLANNLDLQGLFPPQIKSTLERIRELAKKKAVERAMQLLDSFSHCTNWARREVVNLCMLPEKDLYSFLFAVEMTIDEHPTNAVTLITHLYTFMDKPVPVHPAGPCVCKWVINSKEKC